MTHPTLAMLAMAVALAAGSAQAEESTSVYRQGSSSATITQEGGGSTTTRRTIQGPDSQTIIQRQGGNSAVVRQSSGSGMARSGASGAAGSEQMTVRMSPEARQELEDLAADEDSTVEALVAQAIQEFLDRNR
jgi:predicted HicB family RNase H-like nuclease